ncbi:hypothetical protein DSO57_1027306 [Entomophthora muscae]|uniref:Uncharacterized protein n=1 Tax=Entomophthora muscae TaxID=34485 RepID=A0ACC2S3S7_9FUNG|nr:hypothetical protein DSO57_1027306 [Entomophthora muscae]
MALTWNNFCLEMAVHASPATGNVGAFTKGWFPVSEPMRLDPNTFWETGRNFTRHFVQEARVYQALASVKVPLARSYSTSALYRWSGGQPVSDKVKCSESEACAINVFWNGYSWNSTVARLWLGVPFYRPAHERSSYGRDKQGKISFSHTFTGPEEYTVYFNQISPSLQAAKRMPMRFDTSKRFIWERCDPNWLDGVFSLISTLHAES